MKTYWFWITLFTLGTMAACSKAPKTYGTSQLDVFVVDNEDVYVQANRILQADYMFAIDVSASMGFNSGDLSDPYASKREEFLAGLSNFVDSLENQDINYRIGFINANVHAGRVSSLAGRGFYKNILIDSAFPSLRKDGLIDALQDIGQTLKENTNLMLEAADTVMSAHKDSFVRPGSQLIYLFVSDTDDESPSYISSKSTSTSDYASRLIAHKGSASNIPAFVNARAIVAGINSGCNPSPDFGETTGRRLAETAQIIENRNRSIAGSSSVTASQVSHCILRASSEFPTLLAQLARDVSKPTNVFQLQVANVDINSIRVYKNGSLLPNSEWTYLSGSKAVKLNTVPDPATRITIRYNQFYVLKGSPKNIQNIAVSLNGAVVPSSSTDGWVYNPAQNRIDFFGSPLPNGTRIEVSY